MGGFAAGFTSGYGLVNDMEERKRRQAADAANAENLKQRYELAVQEARADEEYRKYMRGQAERDATAAEVAAEATRMKAIFDMQQAGFENLLAADQEARLQKQSKASIAASEAQTAASKATLEKTQDELARGRAQDVIDRQQRAWTNLIGVLQQRIPVSQVKPEILDSFNDLRGTPMDMFYLLNPETQRLANLATSFLSGERQLEGNEQEVNEALTFALQKDLSLLSKSGAVGRNGRINGAAVTGYDVIGQTETGMPVLNVNLRVSAEGGDYDSQITVGRSTDPNAPAASISFDEVLSAVGGYNLSLRALDEDPEFRENMRQLAYSRDPATYNTAITAAETAYKDYYDALPDVVKEQGYEMVLDPNNPDAAPVSRAIRDKQEFIDESLAVRFGPTMPSQLFGPLSRSGRSMMTTFILEEMAKQGRAPEKIEDARRLLPKASDAELRQMFSELKNG